MYFQPLACLEAVGNFRIFSFFLLLSEICYLLILNSSAKFVPFPFNVKNDKEADRKYCPCMAKRKKNDQWLTESYTGWLFLLKRFELSVGYSLSPHQLQVHTPPPSPFKHATEHKYCNKRRPLSTLLESYRAKALLLGNRKPYYWSELLQYPSNFGSIAYMYCSNCFF